MITCRRSEERFHERRHRQELWLTFFPRDRASRDQTGFGVLESVSQHSLPPRAIASRQVHLDTEILTYVRAGKLRYEDSGHGSGLIGAGQFQLSSTGRGIRRVETNASRGSWTTYFQAWLRADEPGLEPSRQQKRFGVATRRGGLRTVASPDGREGSLRLHQDAFIYSAILDVGHQLVHDLADRRKAWLHVVEGQVLVEDEVLNTGDGAGVMSRSSMALRARVATEVLLFDVEGSEAGGFE